MKRYNFVRPLLLIATALLTRSLVTNLCMMFGMNPEAAGNVGFIAMIIAAIAFYANIARKRQR
ncbi:hypothetical protein [Paenibacillus koleovorans]|uniref:hypothetical protein n=1 Tax=Paenibacillus koleovorans TaxID=121608 RepID=UPI000FD94EE9|nr:hypothetical protein [Paenibacillus koleovorans]